MRLMKGLIKLIGVVVILIAILFAYLSWRPAQGNPQAAAPVPQLNHVFVIVMENHSLDALSPNQAPYIHHLIQSAGYDSAYDGVTHVSLPNYVALLSGRTYHTHSDNPTQTFHGPTLASQLDAHHISWQGVMESLPKTGYTGNWYPDPTPHANPVVMPKNALYAKKHDPFMLFPSLVSADARHIVPLTRLQQELKTGHVPRFVWITPNLCNDMHGQPKGSAACPSNHPAALVHLGDQFLSHLVPAIQRSPAFRGRSVIFITWDESQMPAQLWNLRQWKTWLTAGPGAPRTLSIPFGGGSVPLIAIIPGKTQPPHIALWADHYSLLKTIEEGFGLPFLGHARSSQVQPLTPLVEPRR